MESSPTAAGAFFNRSTGGPAVLGRKGGGHGGTVLYQDVPGRQVVLVISGQVGQQVALGDDGALGEQMT